MTGANLTDILDLLLPGGEGFPAASAIGLAAWLRDRAAFSEPVQAVLAALPPQFAAASTDERLAILRALEPMPAFDRLLIAAYSGYYVHPAVLAVIAGRTGYPPRPPQPDGYELSPFDPALLDSARKRPRSYRDG